MTQTDQLRARAIETLMCTFSLDLPALQREFGQEALTLAPVLEEVRVRFSPFVTLQEGVLEIVPEGRHLTRMTAAAFDQHVPDGMTYSRAS